MGCDPSRSTGIHGREHPSTYYRLRFLQAELRGAGLGPRDLLDRVGLDHVAGLQVLVVLQADTALVA